jgi:hypothetical protein
MGLRRSSLPIASLALALAGCSSSSSPAPAQAYVKNGFDPSVGPVGVMSVVYRDAKFDTQLANGAESAPIATGVGANYAYATVAYGWTPGQTAAPQLAVVRTRTLVTTSDDRTVPIVISYADTLGKCGAPAMGEAEYQAIKTAYFPGVAVLDWAAVTCPATTIADAGSDAAAEASVDAAVTDAADAADATPLTDATDAAPATDAAEAG